MVNKNVKNTIRSIMMKNKILKFMLCFCTVIIFLIYLSVFIIQKTFELVSYGELITMDTIQSIGYKKSEFFIESTIAFNIEKIKQRKRVEDILKGIKHYDTIWHIITFDPQKAICTDTSIFEDSKNQKSKST